MIPSAPKLIGKRIREARIARSLTQQQLADQIGTSQSAIGRVETGQQNLTLQTLGRYEEVLGVDLLRSPGDESPTETTPEALMRPLHMRVNGPTLLSGSIDVKSSKNAGVALLCASLLNKGTTTLRKIARIEEINRLIEVLESVGVKTEWLDDTDLRIVPPEQLDWDNVNAAAARRTRSIIMFLGPLLHRSEQFTLPYAGGCELGLRTIEPHLAALRPFGLTVTATDGEYHADVVPDTGPTRPIILTERGDTVTENALLAAARHPDETIIRNASSNYMVQDLCFFLQKLGVEIDGIGTTTLRVRGMRDIDVDVDYAPSEDPIEAMSLLTAAILTRSEITVRRAPIEFLEIELAVLEGMGFRYELGPEYTASNGHTRLVDITTRASDLQAPVDKIHPMPFPGLNIDNLPFFAAIGAVAQGSTLVHDWVYENRAIYLVELKKLGADITLLDPHRIMITGPTRWSGQELQCPSALRPAVVILLAMLASKGTSVLRNVYSIMRGYEDLAQRLNDLGADIEIFSN